MEWGRAEEGTGEEIGGNGRAVWGEEQEKGDKREMAEAKKRQMEMAQRDDR